VPDSATFAVILIALAASSLFALSCILRLGKLRGRLTASESGLAALRLRLEEETAARKKAEESLRSNGEMLDTIMENFPGILFWKDANSVFLGCNRAFAVGAGFECPAEIIGKDDFGMPWSRSESEGYRADDRAVMGSGVPKLHIVEMQHREEGRVIWLDTSKIPLRDSDGRVIGVLGVSADITERKLIGDRLLESEQRYRLLVETANEGILVAQGSNLKFVNPMMRELSGRTEEELLSRPFVDFIHADDRSMVRDNYLKRLAGEDVDHRYQFRIMKKDGGPRWIEITGVRIEWEGRGATLNMLTDITERKESERQIQELVRQLELERNNAQRSAMTDGLTGLANRRHFDEAIDTEFFRAKRSGAPLSLIMLDIDHFKKFNDRYGHVAGDECLKMVAVALQGAVGRAPDMAARYGGEEFVVILSDTDGHGAALVAERIRRAVEDLGMPHPDSDTARCVTVSLGVVTVRPEGPDKPEAAVELADSALYRAKEGGRNRIEVAREGAMRGDVSA